MTPATAASKAVETAFVLMISADPSTRHDVNEVLQQAGFLYSTCVEDLGAAATHCAETQPDMILLDMDSGDGLSLLHKVSDQTPFGVVRPIVAISSDVSADARNRMLAMGATDYLIRPFQPDELVRRVRGMMRLRALQLSTIDHYRKLEDQVRARTREVIQAQMETIERLAAAGEFRDDETGQHAARVGDLSAAVAEELHLDQRMISLLRRAAPLHDIGKIGVPDSILRKPGRLTSEEFEVVKRHTLIGGRILAGSSVELIQVAEQIALSHHERFDGRGYPLGLRESDIPMVGRIVAVADAFDALTHERCYKSAWSTDQAVNEIFENSEVRYDPNVVNAVVNLHQRGRLEQFV